MQKGHAFIGGFSQGLSKMVGASKRLRISAYLSVTFLLLFLGLAIFPVASSVSDTNAAKQDLKTTTLSMSSSEFYANPKVTSTTGTFASSSTEISISTDNYTGYTFGIAAKTDDSDYSKLKSADGEFNSISSATTEASFSAEGATALNGLWGYKPSKINSASNTNYLPAPNFAGDEINRTSGPNAEVDTYTISLGARADVDTISGRYKNSFVLRVVANPIGVAFNYIKNTEDTVTDMPANIAANLSDEKIVVSETAPSRSGYELTGWCDGATRNVLNIDYCDNDKYEGGEDYWLDRTGAQVEVNLYAMWKPVGAGEYICNANANTIADAVCMQDMNKNVKASMVAEQQYQLYDSRDGKKYYVSKLLDGNVWMTQNLDLVLSNEQTLTHANTDLGWAEYDENATWTPARSTFNENEIALWQEDNHSPYSYRATEPYYYQPSQTTFEEFSSDINDCINVTGSKEQCEHYFEGTRYNYVATVAANDISTYVADSIQPNSICPKGWRLPNGTKGSTEGEFSNLVSVYDFASLSTTAEKIARAEGDPLYFNRPGYLYEDSITEKGAMTAFWTNTVQSAEYARAMVFAYGSNPLQVNDWKNAYTGAMVRCVARDSIVVSFDANGGTGTMSSQTLYGNSNLKNNTFVRENKGFVEWNTEPDGSGDSYADGSWVNISGKQDMILYAQWGEQTIIQFDGNGADSGTMASQYINYGSKTTIGQNQFVKADRVFLYWNTQADGSGDKYIEGAEFEATNPNGETVTLYAIWQTVDWVLTVNYVDNSGTNTVKYNRYSYQELVKKVSHTENVDDTGRMIEKYGNSWSEANIEGTERGDKTKAHVLSFPGASKVDVEIYYNGESTSWDWACVWYDDRSSFTASSNCNTSTTSTGYLSGRLGGSQSGTYTVNGNTLTKMGKLTKSINTSKVTFGFKSDGSGNGEGYGYYAIASAQVTSSGFKVAEGAYVTPADLSDSSFLGWSVVQSATTPTATNEQEAINSAPNTNTTYYAIYGKHTVINYDENNGTGSMPSQTIPYTKSAALAKNTFTRSGYSFAGWNTQPDGSGTPYTDEQDFSATNVSGETITLYAQWSSKAEYIVNYHNGESTNTVEYSCWLVGNGITCDENPTSGAYAVPTGDENDVFLGWDTNSAATTASYVDEAAVKASIANTTTDVYAIFGKPTTIKFYGNGGTGEMSDVVIKYGQAGTISANEFVNGNAAFGRWNTQADGSGSSYYANNSFSATNPAGQLLELYAIWSYPTIVHFNANGGTGETMEDLVIPYSSYGSLPYATYEKSGARFARWNKAADDSGSSYTAGNSIYASNVNGEEITLYAIWGNTATIYFDANGGTGTMGPITADYYAYTTLPYNRFIKSGAVFAYWAKNPDGTGSTWGNGSNYYSSDLTGADVTLYAIWGYPTTMKFDANGGTGSIEPITHDYGNSIKIPDITGISKQDAAFVKWNTAADGGGTNYYKNNTYYTNVSGGEITLYAIWRDFTIVYYDGNGADSGTMEHSSGDYNTTITLRDNAFVRDGYTFMGWNTAADGSGSFYPNQGTLTATAQNGEVKTLYAIWKSNDIPDPEGGGPADGMTIARAYEIAYVAIGKGMYVPIKDGQGGYDTHNYKIAESAEDYAGIPANEYRFAMQDMTSEICAMATVFPSNVMTIDLRDQKSYWVTKLADGKCWMTQNLDLDLGGELTSDNTDLNTIAATGMYSTGYSSEQVGDRTIIKWQPINSTVSLSSRSITNWTNSKTVAYSGDPGDWYQQGYTASNCDFFSGCTTNFNTTPDTNNNGTHGHIGNYYTLSAAYATDNNTSDATSGNHWVSNSICPKGWRLPANQSPTQPNSTWEYITLNTLYNNNVYNTDAGLVASPVYMTRGGYIYYSGSNTNATLYNTGLYGMYFMGLAGTYNSSFTTIQFSNTAVGQVTIARDEGYALTLRCVAR